MKTNSDYSITLSDGHNIAKFMYKGYMVSFVTSQNKPHGIFISISKNSNYIYTVNSLCSVQEAIEYIDTIELP